MDEMRREEDAKLQEDRRWVPVNDALLSVTHVLIKGFGWKLVEAYRQWRHALLSFGATDNGSQPGRRKER